ncbi:hypothetical protein CYANOKiyG1_57710 [Okeania sp. KiyG1]|nr:hypothetical protein CYANOKiyG1_57710 [Okeania sp. KiyG1]
MEIVKGLQKDFEICFINGGEVIENFPVPPTVEMINIPPIKTDPEFEKLLIPEQFENVEEVLETRKNQLLEILERLQADILMIELFPFGRRRFSPELIPLIEQANKAGIKVVSSLRDIVVPKQNQARHEEKVCKLINKYFDMLLVHSDPNFIRLEETFSRVNDLKSQVYYTGYVAQKVPEIDVETMAKINDKKPLILVSVGGGRFGHKLLECVVKTAPILKQTLPHKIQMFTGPFIPEEIWVKLQDLAAGQSNINIERYTPNLLNYMENADLSISMSGYNTTMNILMTGVRAMMMAFTGNGDQEQTMRVQKLEQMEIVKMIHSEDLEPEKFAAKIVNYLQFQPAISKLDFNGVEKTAEYLQNLCIKTEYVA